MKTANQAPTATLPLCSTLGLVFQSTDLGLEQGPRTPVLKEVSNLALPSDRWYRIVSSVECVCWCLLFVNVFSGCVRLSHRVGLPQQVAKEAKDGQTKFV